MVRLIKVFVFKFNHFILYLESVTELLDLVLESLLLLLMLGPKSNNLIVSLFSDLLTKNVLMILFLSFFLELSNILSKALDLIIGRGLLLTKEIDLSPKLLVLGFGLVKLNPLVVDVF